MLCKNKVICFAHTKESNTPASMPQFSLELFLRRPDKTSAHARIAQKYRELNIINGSNWQSSKPHKKH